MLSYSSFNNWIDTLLFPIIFTGFLLVGYFYNIDPRQDNQPAIDKKDFEDYKKSVIDRQVSKKREEKINKILK